MTQERRTKEQIAEVLASSQCKHCFDSRQDGEDLCGHCTIWCNGCHEARPLEGSAMEWCARCLDSPVTTGELKHGGPRPCRHCHQRLALAGQGYPHCEKCMEEMWPTAFGREDDAHETERSDHLESTGASLEPSVHRPMGSYVRPAQAAIDELDKEGWGWSE